MVGYGWGHPIGRRYWLSGWAAVREVHGKDIGQYIWKGHGGGPGQSTQAEGHGWDRDCFFQLLSIRKFTESTAWNVYPIHGTSPCSSLPSRSCFCLICIEWWSASVWIYSNSLLWLHTLLFMKIAFVTGNSGFQKIVCFLIIKVMYSHYRTFGKKKKV